MNELVFMDTETTGHDDEDRVIELGFLHVTPDKQYFPYQDYCLAPLDIKFEAMAVHNITPEMIADKPPLTETESFKVLNDLNNQGNYLIAHNSPFDISMLEKDGFVCNFKVIDTLQCSKHLFPDAPSHKLQFMRYFMGNYKTEEQEAEKLGITLSAHSALGDVFFLKMFLANCYKEVIKKFPGSNPLEKLVELSSTPAIIKICPFGKHRGETFEHIASNNRSYLDWALKNMEDLDPNIRFTINSLMGN